MISNLDRAKEGCPECKGRGICGGYIRINSPDFPHRLMSGSEEYPCPTCAHTAQLMDKIQEECAGKVPMNWCDPLLTGPDGIGKGPYSGIIIERLLRGIAAAIRETRE